MTDQLALDRRKQTERELTLSLMDAAIKDKGGTIAEVMAWFHTEWIADPWYRDVADGVLDILKNKHPLSAGSLSRVLQKSIPEYGLTIMDVGELVLDAFGGYHLRFYAKAVYDEFRLRDMSAGLVATGEGLQIGTREVDEALVEIGNFPRTYAPVDFSRVQDAEKAVQEIIDELEGKAVNHISTSLVALDDIMGGLRDGTLVTVAGNTSSGKSTLLGQMAINTAIKYQKGVLYFSAEMPEKELIERWAAWLSRAPKRERRTYLGGLSQVSPIVVKDGLLQVFDSPRHVNQMEREIEAYAAQRNLGLVCVDYIQMFQGGNPKDNRERQVADVTHRLKQIAMSVKVPIVAASQLNRAGGEAPKLSSMRESGSIEQDSDVVILVIPDNMQDAVTSTTLLVPKNRSGRNGDCTVLWDKPIFRFREKDELDYEEWKP